MEKRIRLICDLLPFSKLFVMVKISFDRSLSDTGGPDFALPRLDKVQTLRKIAFLKNEFSERERFRDHVACYGHQMGGLNVLEERHRLKECYLRVQFILLVFFPFHISLYKPWLLDFRLVELMAQLLIDS